MNLSVPLSLGHALYVLFVCKCVLPPSDHPTAVNKYIIININVSIYVSDARELPRRKHKTFRTQWKFEIKNNEYYIW